MAIRVYADCQDGVVDNLCLVDDENIPDWMLDESRWMDVTDIDPRPEIGWTCNGDGTYSEGTPPLLIPDESDPSGDPSGDPIILPPPDNATLAAQLADIAAQLGYTLTPE